MAGPESFAAPLESRLEEPRELFEAPSDGEEEARLEPAPKALVPFGPAGEKDVEVEVPAEEPPAALDPVASARRTSLGIS
jgi:hypothetical protein